ncbi:T9SS sorting signal type C domain-containing protein [Flavobacterium sp.]|uniref:T9SS sorting signal type C domain-containing protein n=1 Tax=Flavobacterium sp. TaxID=239 RepID=UPI00286DA84C|nr:T9SS sorting signal type C domain-containing protein [Flavobacterium sp.]
MKLKYIYLTIASLVGFVTSYGQVSWISVAGATAWYTAGNWSPSTASGAWLTSNTAQFANTGSAVTAGINMGTTLSIGAIEVTSARVRNLTIGNSSATVGNLTLNGTTVNSISNVIVRNNSGNPLTIQNNETGTGKTMGVVLGNATENIINIDGAGGVAISSIISGVGRNLTKAGSGAGILTLSGANTYTGSTTVTAGELRLNPPSNISTLGTCVFNGGTLATTAIASNIALTFSAVNLAASSTLALGSNPHTLTFTTLGTLTASTLLTITGWAGASFATGTTTGTGGKVFIGSTASLTPAQLAQIRFSNGTDFFPAIQLTTGEIVPTAQLFISTISNQTAGVGFNVTVTARDLNGVAARNLTQATDITLTSATNTIGGTTVGTIAAGASSVTISGVTLTAGLNATITATRSSGDFPRTATSNTFNVTAPATPTLSAGALTGFGSSVCVNTTAGPNSFTLSGASLNGSDVSVSGNGVYTFATASGGTYSNPLALAAYDGATPASIFVKFTPVAASNYDGNITISGGGVATSATTAVTGSGSNGTPAVTTVTATLIVVNSASSGGNTVSPSCGTITAKGVVWGLSANPTIASNLGITNEGTGTGSYTSSIGSLSANTLYNYRAYATNSNGVTSYGTNLTFTTLKGEPTNYPTVFACGTTTNVTIPLTWTAATGAVTPDGYLVKWSSTSYAAITAPADGVAEADGATTQNVAGTSYTVPSLSASTTYYFKIWSYTNSGTSIDYKLGSEPQTSCATIAAPCFSMNGPTFTASGSTFAGVTDAGGSPTSTIRLASSSASGSISTTATGVTGGNVTVVFRAQGWSATETSVTVTLDGNVQNITTLPTAFGEVTLNFTSISANPILTFSTVTNKRVHVGNVQIFCAPACTAPGTQASSVTTNTPTTTGFSAGWTAGDGNGRMLVVRPTSTTIAQPVSGTAYTANLAWASAGTIDTNNRVVFRSNGSAAGPITGLTAETQYTVTAYEYNTSADCYNLTTPPSTTRYTLSIEPTPQPTSGLSASTCNATTIDVVVPAISAGADGYLILRRAVAAPTGLPTDATAYVVGDTFGDATVAAIVTAAGTYTISSLTASTTYFFQLVPYNANSTAVSETYNFLTTGTLLQTSVATNATSTSAASTVETDATYIPTLNIAYATYQTTPVPALQSSSIGVHNFIIKDGGATNDSDSLPTILTAISYSYTGTASTIRAAALFTTSGSKVAEATTIGTNTIVFTGLPVSSDVTTPDNNLGGAKQLILRVTFGTTVTDNHKLVFTVTAVTAGTTCSSSQFAAANGGGAVSDNTADDKNRIEVTATKIVYGTQPPSASVSTNLASFSIRFVDDNSNLDFDTSRSVSLAASNGGVNMTSSASYTLTPTHTGIVSFSNVQFSTGPQTNITITASTTGLGTNTVVSDPFGIVDVPLNSYRTIGDGTWSSTPGNNTAGIWEQLLSGTGWTASSYPSTSLNTNKIYIYNNITLNGNNTAQDLVIGSGGVFNTFTITPTFKDVLVKNGGTFKQDGYVAITGILEVEDGGTYQFNSRNNSSRTTTVWAGTERFHPNSTFIIADADTTGDYYPFETEGEISTFTDPLTGYAACFGNIIIDNAAGGNLRLLPTPFTKNLTHGDITFKTNSSTKSLCIGNCTTEIGGDFIIESTYNQTISLLTTGNTVNFKVKGNIINNSTRILRLLNNAGGIANVTVEGDIIINSGTLDVNFANSGVSTVNLKGDLSVSTSGLLTATATIVANNIFNFNKTGDGLTAATTQTIDIATTTATSTNENRYIAFNVKPNAYVQLANRDFEVGTDSKLTVESGGTFDFGFSGTTPLLFTAANAQTGQTFSALSGSTIKLTSPFGITTAGAAATSGNVQTPVAGRTFDVGATYHYIGKANQVTGNALPSAGITGKVIVELDTDALTFNASSNRSFTAAGTLEIRKGIVIDDNTNSFNTNGSQLGNLITSGGRYRIFKTTIQPPFSGTYTLTAGVVEFANTFLSNQSIRSPRSYQNIEVTGNNVDNSGGSSNVVSPISINNNGTFTIAATGKFISSNSFNPIDGGSSGTQTLTVKTGGYFVTAVIPGFYGLAATEPFQSVQNSIENVVLETGSFVEYARKEGIFPLGIPVGATSGNQTITHFNFGTVSNPYSYRNLTISGSGTKTLASNTSTVVGNDLAVNAATLSIETGKALTVTNKVEVNAAAFMTIENNSSLVQINDTDTNTGNITYRRNTAPGIETDYTYWSTPVDQQTLLAVSPLTKPDKFFAFSPMVNDWVQQDTSTIMAKGIGYIIRGSAALPTTGGSSTASFIGKPNNGLMNTIPIIWDGTLTDGSSNLIGNPYPSAIDADKFLTTNGAVIEGTIYLWTHSTKLQDAAKIIGKDEFGNPKVGSGVMAYTSDDYASYNLTGGVGTGSLMAEWVDADLDRIVDLPGEYIERNGNATLNTAEWTDGNSNSTLETNEWTDTNKNNVANTGEWNDLDKDGVLDLPGECPDANGNNVCDLGEWTDTNTDGIFNTGEWNDANKDKVLNLEVAQASNRPTGVIGGGQAFFTTSLLASGTVTFNNSMRLSSTNTILSNTQFYKTSNTKTKTTTIEKHRIWLNLTNTNGVFKETLIGYLTDATNEYDKRFDGKSYDANEFADFYSISQEKNLAIQGRALPFDENDQVPLGFRTTIEGPLSITIADSDGLLKAQPVFIEDKLTSTTFDLRSGAYKFISKSGTFNDRFVLRYTDKTLGTSDFETLENPVLVSSKNKQIKVNSKLESIDKVSVYDLLGRQLFKKDKVNKSEFVITTLTAAQQVLLVKITLQNGNVVTKKIMF